MKPVLLRYAAIAAPIALLMVATLSILTPGTAFAEHDGDPDCPSGTYNGIEYHCQIGERYYSYPNYTKCNDASSGTYYLIVCVLKPGDHVYVKDMQADGRSATAYIKRNDGSGIRRVCRNNKGKGTWVHCNFNWTDSPGNTISYTVYGYEFDQYDSKWTWWGKWTNRGPLYSFKE